MSGARGGVLPAAGYKSVGSRSAQAPRHAPSGSLDASGAPARLAPGNRSAEET